MNDFYLQTALFYLVIINAVTFFMYGIDKLKAKKSMWRIPETTLLFMAMLGGSIGAWLGMKVWHHKTLHKKFRYGVPVIILAQLALVVFLTSCSSNNIPQGGKVTEIVKRGTLLVGTTGDYRPLSFYEPQGLQEQYVTEQSPGISRQGYDITQDDGAYWGFCIDVAKEIAKTLGVKTTFIRTSWPTLTADVMAEPQTFDLAIGGITITDARREIMLMSDGYLDNGKTILCRAVESSKYKSLTDLDKPEVQVMVNPGGLNEKFAHEKLTHATISVHPKNEEIPTLIAEGKADVMITEITEAPYYVMTDSRLAAPLLDKPFTHGEIGVLMRKGQEDLLQVVNNTIKKMKSDGSLRRLKDKYKLP